MSSLKEFAKGLAATIDKETSVVAKADTTPSIIEYIEKPWGLGQTLRPAQKFILKLFYGLPLSDNKTDKSREDYNLIPIWDTFRENLLEELSETEYFEKMSKEGRINLKEPPTKPMNELCLSIGRRGGKSALTSFIASYELFRLVRMRNPLEYYGMLDTSTISITTVAINSDQAGEIFKGVSAHLQKCDYFKGHIGANTLKYIKLKTDHDLEIYGPKANNSSIAINFRGAKAAALRGPSNIVVIFDEAAFYTAEGGSSFDECWDAATPSLAGFKHPDSEEPEGKAIILSSPYTREGLFFKMYEEGMRGHEGRLVVCAPTWEINPTISSKYLRRKYKEKPLTYMQEFGAQFTDRVAGYITREEDLYQNIIPELAPKRQSYLRRSHFMGIDLGLANDGTAIAIAHVEIEMVNGVAVPRYELDYAEVLYPEDMPDYDPDNPTLDFEWVADRIKEWTGKFNIANGVFDQWTGIALHQALQKRGLKQFEMIRGDKFSSEIYQTFKILMFDRKLRLYDSRDTGKQDYISELLSLQQSNEGKYKISVEAPKREGCHDDLSDAVTRAIWLAYTKSQQPGFIAAQSKLATMSAEQNTLPGYITNSKTYYQRKMRTNAYVRQRVVPQSRGKRR